MKPFSIKETYETTSNKLISSMLSDNYYKYVVDERQELTKYKFNYIRYDLSNNKIWSEVEYHIILNLPKWVKNLTKITSYHIVETNEYDTNTNIVNVHTKFPNNPFRHFFDLKYDYLVNQLNETICEKIYTFHIKCDIPALKRPIERLTKRIILENVNKKYLLTTEYLKNN